MLLNALVTEGPLVVSMVVTALWALTVVATVYVTAMADWSSCRWVVAATTVTVTALLATPSDADTALAKVALNGADWATARVRVALARWVVA